MLLLTYDLQTDHTPLKNRLKELGWRDTIQGDNSLVNLPNTCLWKDGDDAIAARAEARRVLMSPNLERLIVVRFDSWAAIVGEAFE